MKRILPIVSAAALIAAAPAQAAKNPYTATQVCGAGFGVIDHQVVSTPKKKLGTTYLLYSAGSGENCAVTLKSYGVGTPSYTGVILQRQGRKQKSDSGNFKYYAGPVKVKAPGVCVRWGGGITVGTFSAGFDTAFEHCG
jgi:hypothetical protein